MKHFKEKLMSDPEKIMSELKEKVSNISENGNEEKCVKLIDLLKQEDKTYLLNNKQYEECETILHIAVKFNHNRIIKLLIETCPELMFHDRPNTSYKGQTALHVAIAKGNTKAVKIMLSKRTKKACSQKYDLKHNLALGKKFANTVMMGELPLSVAALTFNKEMINTLVNKGAKKHRHNSKGDTVFHSLIRYAAIYPEKTKDVLNTLDYLHKNFIDNTENSSHENDLSIWFIPNSDGLNPLQLSASLSQLEIFEHILKLPNVYCFLNDHDGLFDQKSYDITEIDTIATELWSSDQQKRTAELQQHVTANNVEGLSTRTFENKEESVCRPIEFLKRQKQKSILEIMFEIKSPSAFEFLQQPIMRCVIKTKWQVYKWYYYIWMVFHLLFMVTLTVFAVYNSDDNSHEANSSVAMTTEAMSTVPQRKNFTSGFKWIYFSVGLFYFLYELFHLFFRVKSYDIKQLVNILHNGIYRVILTVFSLCLIIDQILTEVMDNYENGFLIISLITGWWFVVFFLRAHKKFGFFTVMIHKIILGDLIRFGLLICLMLIAFSAAVNMAFKGSITQNKDLLSYPYTMMLLFKLMMGLGDIEELYEARRPWIAVCLFIAFVILTYVLMMNALIAMMSQTCTIVSENRHIQWRVQQLSIIMFFEGILPASSRRLTKLVGEEKVVKRFDSKSKQREDQKRYFLDISSLQNKYASPEDISSSKEKTHTADFAQLIADLKNTMKDIHGFNSRISKLEIKSHSSELIDNQSEENIQHLSVNKLMDTQTSNTLGYFQPYPVRTVRPADAYPRTIDIYSMTK